MQDRSKGPLPRIVARDQYLAEVDALRVREKALTTEEDAIAAARRRLPMTEIDGMTSLVGADGPTTLLAAFEGRRMLIAYYFMWFDGKPAEAQCEGCTYFTSQMRDLTALHSRDVTYATLCQGPYDVSARYRDFMGWTMPWYSAKGSLDALLAGRKPGMMHLISYLRDGDRVFETYWTWMRGVQAMDNNYALPDMTAYGRQEEWEDSPEGYPKTWGDGKPRLRSEGRPIGQWLRLEQGFSDKLDG